MYKESETQLLKVADELQLDLAYAPSKKNNHSANSDTISLLSLFSGCGGMDLGFEGGFEANRHCINEAMHKEWVSKLLKKDKVLLKKTRFKTVFANDISEDAKKAWAHYFNKNFNHDPEVFKHDSIVNIVKQYYNGVNHFPQNVDIVTGGFPCQDFSLAGKRRGFNSHKSHDGKTINPETFPSVETRGQLYMWMKQVIEITKPKMFIAENVKGLVNLENVKEIIQNDFSSAGEDGYLVINPQVLHAANFGIPQSRERVFFIGFRKSALKPEALQALSSKEIPASYSPYPHPTHNYYSSQNQPQLAPPVTLRQIFSHLPEPNNSTDKSHFYYSKAKYMGAHCQGQSEVKLDGIGPTIRAEHHGNIEFRRLSTEHHGKYLDELKKGHIERRLTLRECGLIQTFPENFDFVISDPVKKGRFILSPSQGYKLIGNAVPPLLAYNIARRVEFMWPKYFK